MPWKAPLATRTASPLPSMWARWRRRPSRPQAALPTSSRRSCGRLLLDLRPKGMTNGAAGRLGLRHPRAAAMQTGLSHSRRRSSESLWSRGDGGPAVSTTSCHRPPADRESSNIGRIGRCCADSQGLSCTHKIAHRTKSTPRAKSQITPVLISSVIWSRDRLLWPTPAVCKANFGPENYGVLQHGLGSPPPRLQRFRNPP